MPMLASAISFASRCASVALEIVNLMGAPVLFSTSFFKAIILAMISALCASTTSVTSP